MARLGGPRRRRTARPVLALAMTTTVFGALAAFGGVSYAVDTVSGALGSNSTVNHYMKSGSITADGHSGNPNTGPSSDSQYGASYCVENVNPHGQTIPPAGQTSPGTNPRSGQNPDGFYKIGSGSGDFYVVDMATGHKFGPFPSGTIIKYTQAQGDSIKSIGSSNGQAGAVAYHITGTGDAEVVPAVSDGTFSICLVPKPPK